MKTNSVDALEHFRSRPNHYDLVITDQLMPNLTGLDLADNIKKIQPDIAVILCTAYSELITADVASDFGIDKILLKPVVMGQLKQVVDKALG